MNIKKETQSNAPQRHGTGKFAVKGQLKMYKCFIIAIALMLPTSAFGQTIYFKHDAESPPIAQGDPTTTWGLAQSLVSRSQNFVRPGGGNSALRHEMVSNVNIQTGKVISFLTLMPQGGLVDAYYSSWYYIEQGFDDTNPNVSKNNMQWKGDNDSGAINSNVKIVIGFLILDSGVRQVMIGIDDCGLVDGDFPQYDTLTPGFQSSCKIANAANPKPIVKNQWFHLEVFLRQADPARLGNQVVQQNGIVKIWQDGELIIDLDHPNLNTLTTFNQDSNNPNQWANNQFLFWGIGMYGSSDSQPPQQILYTDDAMITDYPVHQDFSSDTLPPAAPTGLAIAP